MVGWIVAIVAWGLHVGALALAPLSIVQAARSGRFSIVVANPPFSSKNWGHKRLKAQRDPFGRIRHLPRKSHGEMAFVLVGAVLIPAPVRGGEALEESAAEPRSHHESRLSGTSDTRASTGSPNYGVRGY